MFKSAFWAFCSLIATSTATTHLMIAGYYLSQNPDPAIAYLGLFLEWFGGAIICGIVFQLFHTHETRTLLNKAFRGGKK